MSYSDNNSIIRNQIDTDADHPEPNLVGHGMSLDSMRKNDHNSSEEKPKKEDIDLLARIQDKNLDTTTVDMGFQYFANMDKVFDKDNLKLFNQDNRSDSEKSHYKDRKDSDSYDDHKTEYPQPKPSASGPSYGEDKYDESERDRDRHHKHSDYDNEFSSKEEEMLAKLDMLRKLGELTQYGVKLSQRYSMESDFKAMKYEYELHKSIRDKANGVKWLSNLMLNMCYGIEIANEKFNPFDFHLKGWSEQMAGEQKDYYEVLGEIYEKYFKTGKPIPPEIKLFFMISGSAIQFHLAHTMLSSFQDMGTELNNNPALAEKLRQQAAADKMRTHYEKQKSAFDNHATKMHEEATKKATDLQQLKEQQVQYMAMQQQQQHEKQMQDQIMQEQMLQNHIMQENLKEKQRQLEILQRQLNLQQSDSRSMYNVMDTQPTINPPKIPASLRKTHQETLRQQQIKEHKKRMEKDMGIIDDETLSFEGSAVHMNKDMDKLFAQNLETRSRVTEGSTIDADELNGSEDSKVKLARRRRRKKAGIKISTAN